MSDLQYPDTLKYTTDHEWVMVMGETARVGITDYAQDALGDIVYVQLPETGDTVAAGAACGEVESTKSVSELFAPVSGEVTAVNAQLDSAPEACNSDPYGEGWLFEIALSDVTETDDLMDASEYQKELP
jgi:glycine cleavage system H protein